MDFEVHIYGDIDISGKFSIKVNENDTVSDLIRKIKNYNHYMGNITLFSRNKILNEYLDKKLKFLIKPNSIIKIIDFDRAIGGEVGGAAKSIADPTKKEPVEWPTTHDGPFYLTVKNGINLFGYCQNKSCIAYKKEVCSHFGFGIFDLINDLNTKSSKCPKCPACEYLLLELDSCGFMNCIYNYKGKKFENNKIEEVDYSKTTKGGNKALDYVDPGKSGENKSLWIELKISAKPLK